MFYVHELRDETGAVFYVGKGSKRRMYVHKYKAIAGQDSPRANRIRAILSAGGSIVPVIVLETPDELTAFAEEKRLIAQYGRDQLTNETCGGGGIRDLSARARAKIAAGKQGKIVSEVTRQRQREAKLGKPRTPETRAKISAYQKGRAHPWARAERSAEYRQLMSELKKGIKHTPESRAKISASKMGHTVSEETRAKISATRKGTPAWNKGFRGSTLSAEQRAKLSQAQRARRLREAHGERGSSGDV